MGTDISSTVVTDTAVDGTTAAAALEHRRDLRATIVDSSFYAIVSLEFDGTITSWNSAAEAMYGWSEVEAIGRHVSLIHPDRVEMDALIQTARSQKVSRLETVRMTRSGESIDVLVTVSPILAQDGSVVGVSSISSNIHERVEADAEKFRLNDELEKRVASRTRELSQRTAELEKSVAHLDSFAYSVSHDLRAPLRAMDGFSRIVLDEIGPDATPEVRRHLEIIRKSAQDMQLLIDGLLDLSRLTQREFHPVELAPAPIAHRAITDLGAAADRADVDITIDDLPNCTADPTLLKQVFVNLIGNALKFTSKVSGARIHVGAQGDSLHPVYFVKDNGTGFDPRYTDKIFGVFQRLHRVEDYEGTGIGLALVQRIVEKHGGRVWCEAAPDEGATFFFTIGEAKR
jgi:PAS domain S-box-containing protein